jgi:hypothetical protein
VKNSAGYAQLQGFCVVIFPANEDCVFTTTLSRPLTPRNSTMADYEGSADFNAFASGKKAIYFNMCTLLFDFTC